VQKSWAGAKVYAEESFAWVVDIGAGLENVPTRCSRIVFELWWVGRKKFNAELL
jgi:hypothetical protein